MDEWKEKLRDFIGRGEAFIIVGMGNEYRTDDGAGIALVRMLKEKGMSEQLLLEAGRNLVNFLPEMEERRPSRLLFVDVANMGLGPGDMVAVERDQITEKGLSTHENNLALVLGYLDKVLPGCHSLFLAIQFSSLDMCGGPTLTDEIDKAVGELADHLLEILG